MENNENREQEHVETHDQSPSEGIEAVAQEVAEQQSAPEPTEDYQSRNFKMLREQAKQAERERDALRAELESYKKPAQQEAAEDDDDFDVSEDDIIEGRHLKKVKKELRNLKSQLKKQEEQSYQMGVETRLKAQYPDFDLVVSKDNIELLKMQHPEIAATLSSSTDLYSSAVSAYTFIKQLKIGDDSAYRREKDIAHKNAAKPRPLASVSPQQGDSPLSHANAFANGLTDDLKAQLLKEMNESRKSF